MGEREKMLSGVLYDPSDETLVNNRNSCKILCQKFNSTPYCEAELKKELLNQIIGKTKGDFTIEPSFWCDYGYNIELGKNFYSNHNLVILDCALVTFGDNVFIGPNCSFYTAEHPIDYKTRNKGLESAKPIKIGNNVWFGGSVTVLAGVTIGNNSVIGAGSVVVRDVPSNSVAVGNPCRVIKKNDNK